MSTTPRGSTSASAALDGSDDPWALAKGRFLSDLDSSERDLFNNATLENLYYTTSNSNRDDVEKSLVRAVATKLGPLVSAIESYGKALDTFAQTAPLYLAPIWGSLRVLLVLARGYGKFFERLVDTLGRIGDVLPRFRDYERIYGRQKHQRLTQALSSAYLDIIIICTQFRKTIREQKSSSFRRLLKPLSLDRQLDEAVERFREHKKNVEEEARVCHMIEAAEKRDEELTLFAVERKRRLLSRLSTVGFEYKHQKLKSLRHIGTGVWLLENAQYIQWYTSTQSAVMCCYGIPGCGKSVLSSSIVDSFGSADNVVYYYCDYSDKRTLDPANLFGTLAHQVLMKINTIPEPLATLIEEASHDGNRLTDHLQALDILQECLSTYLKPLYMSIDGLDEMTEESQKINCRGLSRLVNVDSNHIKLFMTGREDLANLLWIKPTIPYALVSITTSAITSDILLYVRASTHRRITEGSLVIQDPILENIIVDELVKGAHGMFLWVEFQLCDLCEAESDHGIRRALENLPKSLGETYDRLLAKITGDERREMIVRMFKWIVCSRRPLLVDEMREAIAFTLEDEEWQREKIVTSIDRLIRACGNLVIVDGDTKIVQFAHYTVQQYLLASSVDFFHFTSQDANIMAGEFCIAYLNFSNFETQVTKFRPNAYTDMTSLGMLASNGSLVSPDLSDQPIFQLWNNWRGTRATPRGLNIAKYTPEMPAKKEDLSSFVSLDYAIAHWHSHTIHFELNPGPLYGSVSRVARRYRLFRDLVLSKNLLFDFRPWGQFSDLADKLTSVAILGWALAENHAYLILMTCQAQSPLEFMQPDRLLGDAWSSFVELGELSESRLRDLELLKSVQYPSSNDMNMWLLSRIVVACQQNHIYALKNYYFDASLLNRAFVQFLTLTSAASANVHTMMFLADQVSGDEELHRLWSDCSTWRNSLERAVVAGNCDTVSYLLSRGYRAPHLFVNGVRAYLQSINAAIKNGSLGALQCLVMISDTLPFNITAAKLSGLLVLTTKLGLQDTVGILLRCSALRSVVTLAFQHALELSLQHGTDFGACDSLLQLATIASGYGSSRMLQRLLNMWGTPPSGIDPNDLANALVMAVKLGLQDAVKVLLDCGAYHPKASNRTGSVAVIAAVRSSQWESLFKLLQRRCPLGPTPLGMPLTIAAAMGDFRTAKALVALGAEYFGASYTDARSARLAYIHSDPIYDPIDYRSSLRVFLTPTPLYMACYYGHKEIVEYLLNHGADPWFVSPNDIFAFTISPEPRYPTCCRQHICPNGSISNVTETAGSIVVLEWRYPIAAAMEQGHEDIVALLTSSTASENSGSTSSYHSTDTWRRDWPPLRSMPFYCSPKYQSLVHITILRNAVSQLSLPMDYREQLLSHVGRSMPAEFNGSPMGFF